MKLVTRLVMVVVVPALVLSLLLFPIADSVSAEYQTSSGWTKYTGDLDLGDEVLVMDAWVIKDGDTYRMWYTRLRLNEAFADIADRITALNGPAIADAFINMDLDGLLNLLGGLSASDVIALLDSATTVIGYATSTNGIDWTIENNEVLAGGGSLHNGIGAPSVIKDGTTYKMWYTRFEVDWEAGLAAILTGLAGDTTARRTAIETFLNQTRSVIGYATSDDLITWTIQNSQVFPAADSSILASVGAPGVIWNTDDTQFEMWYTGVNTDLTLADISDVLTATGSFDMDAIVGLVDGSASVIGYATSADGVAWTDVDNNVLSGSGPVWESVGDPCVVKVNGTYEMWYTRGTTDLTAGDFNALLTAINDLDLSGLWTTLDTSGISDFLTAYLAKNLTTINGLISNTSSVIGYATSDDGAVWTVQEESDLTGSSTNLWSSVGAPSVLGDGTNYTMWFTEGIGTLDFQSLFDLIFGGDCTIGQATYPPSGGGFPGGGGRPPPPPGTTPLAGLLDVDGYFIVDVTATSEDELASVTIPEGTQGLDEFGYPLNEITIVEIEESPDPPTDHAVIGIIYDFGPDGATFDPPITLTITYDPALLPEGVDEVDLVVARWDEDTETWVKLPSVVDPENNTITVEIDGFTGFAILAANAPADFTVLFLSITPATVDINRTVEVSVDVINTGDLTGTYQIELLVNGEVEEIKEVTLDGSGRITVSFYVIKSTPGRYTVSIGDLTGSFIVNEAEVIEPPETEPEPEADIVVSELLVTPPAPRIGETVTISVLVINEGDGEGSYNVILFIDDKVAESRTVTLLGNSEQTITFTTTAETTGVHTVEVDNLSALFAVLKGVEVPEESAALNWWLIGGIIGGCAVITAIATIYLLRRRFA